MIRIGFDVSQTGKRKTGCGYFADSLIQALAQVDGCNQYILYPTFGAHFWDHAYSKTRQINTSRFTRSRIQHASLEKAQQFWQQAPAALEQAFSCVDIVHANNFFCPPRIPKTKLLYTLYDLSFIEKPEYTTEANRVACFAGVFNASLRADYLVAISEYSLKHFLQMFPHYPEKNISVVYPASRYCKEEGTKIAPSKRIVHLQPNQFWLCVSTLEPRKNHVTLLKAYAQLKAQGQALFPVVLAGGDGWMMTHFQEMLAELNLLENVQVLGYVSDKELQWLYQHCFCLVYPSLFEGFGLPVLEAMSLGAPVIAANTTSIPEIVGSAGILVDPLKTEGLFQAMLHLQQDPSYHHHLKVQAKQQSRQFSWRQSAQQMLAIYEKLIA